MKVDGQCDRLFFQAIEAQNQGRLDIAERLATEALELDPRYRSAKFLLGSLYARQGEVEKAERFLLDFLADEPRSFEALVSLSNLYRESLRFEEAIDFATRATAIRPGAAQAHHNLGRSFLAARRLEEAAEAFLHAISLQPNFSPALLNLGKVRQLEGRDGEAANWFQKAVEISPSLDNLLPFGQSLLALCDYSTALRVGRQSVSAFPNSAAAHLLLCGVLTELGQTDEADVHLEEAIRLDITGSEAMHVAARQRPLGYIEEANASLRRAIEKNPRLIPAYDALMQNQRVSESDRPLVLQMEALLESGRLSTTEQVALNYALGKALEDLGEGCNAMQYYDVANQITRRLKLGEAPFDSARYSAYIDSLIRDFADFEAPQGTCESERPILIVGMMRSGTTLAEQILSSHGEVTAAGEQLYWTQNWSRALEGTSSAQLGEEYDQYLGKIGKQSPRVTDKMPGNYLFLGLIQRSLPNARIIHVRRSPIDTCLSIWTTPNHMPHEGGHVKSDIAYVYREYLRIMSAWRQVLPTSRFLEIDYEELVAKPEPVVRQMLGFCGLQWDEACLRPHENKRIVNTPSAWQVRQPVYRTSIERWRRFLGCLGDFEQLLQTNHS